MIFEGLEYEIVVASDVQNDGLGFEVYDISAEPRELVLEIYRSDVDGSVSITTLGHSLPLALVEQLIARARAELRPK
jgi:hypothetical protein